MHYGVAWFDLMVWDILVLAGAVFSLQYPHASMCSIAG